MKRARKPSRASRIRGGTSIRPLVQRLHAYVPGEQPKIPGLVKLNTNENPYPPSPVVLRSVRAAVDGRLRLYPNPTSQNLRVLLSHHHRCRPENIVVGNGSDDLLALATRAFVEPEAAVNASGRSRATVQYFTPSYSLYPVLAATHGAYAHPADLDENFDLPTVAKLKADGSWDFHAALTLVTTPNAPTGRGYSRRQLDALCRAQRGIVLLDEAYVDFADDDALDLALRYPHVLAARTFSKAYSLCFQRVGYAVGHPSLIEALDKVRDSYNVNGLGQVAAAVTLANLPYYRKNFRKIIATRQRLSAALRERGFLVLPSQANFIFTRPPGFPARVWLQKLRNEKVLVRWFDAPRIRDFLRITIGTDVEATVLLQAVDKILP